MKKTKIIVIAFITLCVMCLTTNVSAAGSSVNDPIRVTFGKSYSKTWTVANDNDKTYHEILIPQKGIITMNFSKPFTSSGAPCRLLLTIRNQNGDVIWDTINSQSKNTGGNNYTVKLGLNPGKYYVVLEAGFEVITGTFTSSYKFQFEKNNYVEIEPNETSILATNLEFNHMYKATYGNDSGIVGEYDFYKFNAVKGVVYQIAIGNFRELNSTSTMIALYTPKVAAYIHEGFGNIDQNGTATYRYIAIESGTHYIRLNNYSGMQKSYSIGINTTGKGIPELSYQTQVQKRGWLSSVSNGGVSGTTGSGLRMETLKVNLTTSGYQGGIEYRTHVQKKGWESSWKKSGQNSGSVGEGLRLEAVQIRLTGEISKYYDIYYRIHSQRFGWLDWTKNGASAGTAGFGFRVEAIQIKLVKKGESAPGKTTRPYVSADNTSITYQTQVQKKGWLGNVSNGATSGTVGEGLRMEALKIHLKNQGFSGNIEYRTHIQKQGWESTWKKNGEMSGTAGKGLRLEALQLRLTGNMATEYDIYYRVQAQKYGWLGWAKNGESAGTSGKGLRLEAIQIVLVRKGMTPPGSTANHYYSA